MVGRRKDLDGEVAELEALAARFHASTIRRDRAAIVRGLRALTPEPSWSAIGELFGISGERARQLGTYDKEQ